MENAEEIMHTLEEFSKLKPKDIPNELDDYLGYVARTGDPVFKWSIIKCLFREKLLNVITDFYESTSTIELPPCPNVDPFNYERMKANLLEKLDSFQGAPFTVQRISELLTNPRKEYNRADKFMRAIEKNILVVSTREPGREADAESYNGMPDANDSGVETGFPCNDFSDPDSTAQSYEAKTEQAETAYQVTDAAEGSSSMTDEGPSASVAQDIHERPATVAEEKDPDSVICSTSASEQSQPSEPTEHMAPGSGESVETRKETAVASTSEASYDLGSSHVEPSPSTSTAEPAGFPEEPAVFVDESPIELTSHPVEAVVQMDTCETVPTTTAAEEVSTSDISSSEESNAQENLAGEEETSAEAVPLSTETPEADLQCAESVSFEDDRPSQSESATIQPDCAANQTDFLIQSESSGSDSNPSGEEPLPSEPEPAPIKVQDPSPEQEHVEVNISFEAEPSVTTSSPALETSGDAPAVAEAQVTSCEEPQPSEPTKDDPQPELTPQPEHGPELKSEPEQGPELKSEPEQGPELKSEPEQGPELKSEPEQEPELKSEPGQECELKSEPQQECELKSEPHQECELKSEPHQECELKSESEQELEVKPEPELKPSVDSGDQSRETSVIHTTSSDVDEPMEVDECQAPQETPLP